MIVASVFVLLITVLVFGLPCWVFYMLNKPLQPPVFTPQRDDDDDYDNMLDRYEEFVDDLLIDATQNMDIAPEYAFRVADQIRTFKRDLRAPADNG